MTTYYNITRTNGTRARLVSNDTFTLAFCPGMIESTPTELRAFVSEKSLIRLAKNDGLDSKAAKALALRFQRSFHGAGRVSVQIFDDENGGKLAGDFNI